MNMKKYENFHSISLKSNYQVNPFPHNMKLEISITKKKLKIIRYIKLEFNFLENFFLPSFTKKIFSMKNEILYCLLLLVSRIAFIHTLNPASQSVSQSAKPIPFRMKRLKKIYLIK